MIKVNNIVIERNHFPDRTQLLHLSTILQYPGDGAKIIWKYENDEELVTLIYIVRHLQDKGFYPLRLYMNYIPNARQDRVKNEDDVFTLKYFCEVINSLGFDEVHVLDAHSNVSLALLDRVVQEPVDNYIRMAITNVSNKEKDKLMLFFPDEGAMKRYSDKVQGLGYKIGFGIKKRNWETGHIEGLDIMGAESFKDESVLIIDDICSKGGTFYHSAKALKEAGAANIYLYVTHCENTIHEGELLKSDLITHIYTTNSLLTKFHDKITVLK